MPDACGKKLFMDFSKPEGVTVPVIDGIWDVESAGNQYVGDNAFYYSFKLYGRRAGGAKPKPEQDDKFGGGWTMIFRYNGEETIGDTGVVEGDLPKWYKDANGAPFDQYLWVDEGTIIDYLRSNDAWRSEGYDTGKHYFFAEDGTKLENQGQR